MAAQFQPSSPTPRPEGMVEALAASPPITRRRRLNSCSSGAGHITGIAGWRRAPANQNGSKSSLGMGMQSTPAKRSKSIDTIPWDSKASRKTEKQAEDAAAEEGGPRDGESEEQRSGSDTPLRSRQLPIDQWRDPLETSSESTREVYQDLEVPLKLGTSSAPVTPRSSAGGKRFLDVGERTPRGRRSSSTAESFLTYYDITAPLNDEAHHTPTSAERKTSSKIASRQLTPRPRLDLPPSDPPWSSTPSGLREEPSSQCRRRNSSSPSPPELPRRRYSTPPPWEVLARASPPSPLHFGALVDDEFESPSSAPLAKHGYNPEREKRALQPDPFGFSRIAAMVEGAS